MLVEKSAGAIIFRKERSKFYYLLLHYPLGSRIKKDYWDFPKGHIEKGETEIEAAKREIEEETGIKDLRLIKGFKEEIKYSFKVEKNNTFKTVVFYLAGTKTREVRISQEHIGYKWLPYEEALGKLTFKNVKEILKKANQHLAKLKNV